MQEVQVPFVQELHPEDELPAKGLSTPLIPNTDIFFTTSPDEQFGQLTALLPNTRTSNSLPHPLHLYS